MGRSESAEFSFPRNGRIVVRTAAITKARVRVDIDDRPIGTIDVEPSGAWDEPSIDLPPGVPKRGRVTLTPIEGDWVDYHVWVVEAFD
jgi:hypothetical protein